MSLKIISANAAGRVDGTVKATILDRLAAAPRTPDATVVAVGNFPDFRFNPELLAIRGPWVMVDFMEYGATWTGERTHLFGAFMATGVRDQPEVCRDAAEEWAKLASFVWTRPPSIYFKRELSVRDVVDAIPEIPIAIRPIDWPAMQPAPPLESKAEFDARPIEVFHCWGYSHPLRPILHADIFRAMATAGIDVLSSFDQPVPTDGHRTWASIHAPWQTRRPMAEVMRLQQRAKISVSLPGFGLKCFRHAEAPVGAVMAMADDPLAWSFAWQHGVNCIRIGRDSMLADLMLDDPMGDLRGGGLYDIYRRSQETIDRYRPDRYVNEYLLPLIREAC